MTISKPTAAPDLSGLSGPVVQSVNQFVQWLEKRGYASYDPYDIWGTRFGIMARRIYYKHSLLGLPLVGPILFMEILFPGWRALFVRKQRYATADAQLVLAFLNLYEITHVRSYLDKAVALGKDLLASSIPGYSGCCWGYPFIWQHSGGCWPKNTPYITVTPYCYEAFAALHDATGDPSYGNIVASIARFVHDDLLETKVSETAAASSYSPIAQDKVVNVSAYRAWVLFDAARRLDNEAYAQAAQRYLNFVLESQRDDGSWYYEIDGPAKPFIDHFHTCFVLKSLHKINRSLHSPKVDAAIQSGFDYYRKNLFSGDDEPKTFASKPRTQIVKLEMYDLAEDITLGTLLRAEIPEAFELSKKLAARACAEYQLPAGHFITRIYRNGRRHKLPYLRWSQAQVFYSLTNLLRAQSASS